MVKYKCHKEVKAVPMNRGDYNEYRGWDLPEDEDGSDAGYLVECIDGGHPNYPNHPEHKGYISWSPKEQFDTGYTVVIGPNDELLKKITEERADLTRKIDKLQTFLGNGKPSSITGFSWAMLQEQYTLMCSYCSVLSRRREDLHNQN